MVVQNNVLGQVLQTCGVEPVTGFSREGTCKTGEEDVGVHGVCAIVTRAFLEFSKKQGNDLSTPRPEFGTRSRISSPMPVKKGRGKRFLMHEQRREIVIVGGGIAGLSCARSLQRKGHDILVLEAAASIGGRLQTDRFDGFLLVFHLQPLVKNEKTHIHVRH